MPIAMPDNYDDLSDDLAARREAFPEPDFDSFGIEAARAVDMSSLGGPALADFFGPFLILPDDDDGVGGGFTVGVPSRWPSFSVGLIIVNLTGQPGTVRFTGSVLGGSEQTHEAELTASSSGQYAKALDSAGTQFTTDLRGVTLSIVREEAAEGELTGSLWCSGLAVRYAGQ